AVMDIGAAGFQDNRPLATMVVPIIKDQGRGLVTFDAGLNAADQVARREDVAAAVIFRDLDGAGEDTPLIRRYLDRAAFKAAQEGRVVVVGTTRPETIAALMEWSIEGKGASVALAPISAVLAVK
ncbi:MAG: divergent polysaccharide deacetylase family protein, partial [Cypionkella sp.]|nr:divergent polysaccharide deacetylase family protein [Cypionkella sp.]